VLEQALRIDWQRQAVRRQSAPLPPLGVALGSVPLVERLRIKSLDGGEQAELLLATQYTDLGQMDSEFWQAFEGLDRDALVQRTLQTLADRGQPMTLAELAACVGQEVAVTDWFTVTQQHIDQFAAATGDVIVTMDGDLQDDPRDLPALLAALESGADLVNGAKTGAHDAGKPLTSRLFNWTVRLTTGLRLRDLNCPFKVYRAELAKTLELHGELFRFIPLLAQLRGFRVAEVPVANRPRRFGRSKFGPGKLLHGLFDLATVLFLYQYNFRPLHLFGSTGLILGTTGFAINLGLTLRYLCNGTIGDHKPLLMGGILLIIVGVQLISTGLLGELIARGQASQRDAEVVEEIRRGLR